MAAYHRCIRFRAVVNLTANIELLVESANYNTRNRLVILNNCLVDLMKINQDAAPIVADNTNFVRVHSLQGNY